MRPLAANAATAISAHVIHAPMPSNQTTATAPSAPVATADSR